MDKTSLQVQPVRFAEGWVKKTVYSGTPYPEVCVHVPLDPAHQKQLYKFTPCTAPLSREVPPTTVRSAIYSIFGAITEPGERVANHGQSKIRVAGC